MWVGIGIKFLKNLRLVSSFKKPVVSLESTLTVEGMKRVETWDDIAEVEMGENTKDSLEKGNDSVAVWGSEVLREKGLDITGFHILGFWGLEFLHYIYLYY
jgi:hypothetical protein